MVVLKVARKWRTLAVLLLLAGWGRAGAAAAGIEEYELKAAFLYNFAKFVEWPPDAFAGAASPVTLCILGEDPFGKSLDAVVQGESLNGRPLAVRRLRDIPPPGECHILFLSGAEKARTAEAMKALRGASVLSVGEGRDFLEHGGVIRLFLDQSRVRFDINLEAAERAHLTVSSKLLRLARAVNPQRQEK